MNSQRAKEVLMRCRLGTSDESDPEIQEALRQAADDPELTAWFGEHRVFQQKVATEFRNQPVPAGLREQILSEAPAAPKPASRRRAFALAATACVLLLIGVDLFVQFGSHRHENRFAVFRSRMVKAGLRAYAMDIQTGSAAELRSFLDRRRGPAGWTAPAGLNDWPLLGGAVLKWQDHPAAMICFGRNQEPQSWLFVINTEFVPDPPGAGPDFKMVNSLNTMSWSEGGLTYVLAGQTTNAQLRTLFEKRG